MGDISRLRDVSTFRLSGVSTESRTLSGSGGMVVCDDFEAGKPLDGPGRSPLLDLGRGLSGRCCWSLARGGRSASVAAERIRSGGRARRLTCKESSGWSMGAIGAEAAGRSARMTGKGSSDWSMSTVGGAAVCGTVDSIDSSAYWPAFDGDNDKSGRLIRSSPQYSRKSPKSSSI